MSMSESDKAIIDGIRLIVNAPEADDGITSTTREIYRCMLSIIDRQETEIKRLREGLEGLRQNRIAGLRSREYQQGYNDYVDALNSKITAILEGRPQ